MTAPDETDLADEQLAMDAAYAEECEANRLVATEKMSNRNDKPGPSISAYDGRDTFQS